MNVAADTVPLPREVQIEPTVRCNLDCGMCNARARARGAPDMPLVLFRRILNQFPHIKKVHLHGIGEPLLNPDFFGIMQVQGEKEAKNEIVYL